MQDLKIKPLVTVVMPVFNAEKYVGEAIESIQNQSLKMIEFIIIDDGSTDRSSEVINEFSRTDRRIRVLKNTQNIGISKSLNMGIHTATTDFIARMDADDIACSQRLEEQLKFLMLNKEYVAVGSYVRLVRGAIFSDEIWKMPTDPYIINWHLIWGNPLSHSSIMFRRQEVINSGGYSETQKFAQDGDLWIRLSNKYLLGVIPQVLMNYRIHNFSQTQKNIFTRRIYISKNRVTALKKFKINITEEQAIIFVPPYYGNWFKGLLGIFIILKCLVIHFIAFNPSQRKIILADSGRKIFKIAKHHKYNLLMVAFCILGIIFDPSIIKMGRKTR